MATARWLKQNRRMTAYLPDVLFREFSRFQSERGYDSQSQTLVVILEEYFGCGNENAVELRSLSLAARMRVIEEKLEALNAQAVELASLVSKQDENLN